MILRIYMIIVNNNLTAVLIFNVMTGYGFMVPACVKN